MLRLISGIVFLWKFFLISVQFFAKTLF